MSVDPAELAERETADAIGIPDALRLAIWRNRLLVIILVLLVLTLSALASRVVVPILVALLFSLMLAPPVRWLTQWRLPRTLASLLVLGIAIAVGGIVLNALARPALDWVAHAPKAIDQFAHQLRGLWRPIADASKATAQITQLTQSGGAQPQPVRVVESGAPDSIIQVLSAAPAIIMEIFITLMLVFVFLQHGDSVLRKAVELAPDWQSKRGVVDATRDAQRDLSAYVLTISLINLALGAATAAALWAFGIPDPLLWGGVAALLNFAPYIGPWVTAISLAIVGMTTQQNIWLGLAPPAAFVFLHLIESFILTPLIAGRRLALDPVVIFLALLLFGWMWSIPGLLIAVPLLNCCQIVASRVPAWSKLAKLLGN